MLERLKAKKAECEEVIRAYQNEIAKAYGKMELIQELIDEEEQAAAEKAETTQNGYNV